MSGPYKAGPKPATRSKTLWTATAFVVAAAGVLAAEYNWPGMFGPKVQGAADALLVAAFAFGALRFFTRGPITSR